VLVKKSGRGTSKCKKTIVYLVHYSDNIFKLRINFIDMTKIEEIKKLRSEAAKLVKTKYLPRVCQALKSYQIEEISITIHKEIFANLSLLTSGDKQISLKIHSEVAILLGHKVSNLSTGKTDIEYRSVDFSNVVFNPDHVDYFIDQVEKKLEEVTKGINEEIAKLKDLIKIVNGGMPEFYA
jgi:hypothetical protein